MLILIPIAFLNRACRIQYHRNHTYVYIYKNKFDYLGMLHPSSNSGFVTLSSADRILFLNYC